MWAQQSLATRTQTKKIIKLIESPLQDGSLNPQEVPSCGLPKNKRQ